MSNLKKTILTSILLVGLASCTPSPEKAYETLQTNKSIVNYDEFIATYPESSLLAAVKKEKQQFEYDAALASDNLETLEDFVAKYPQDLNISFILKKIEAVMYQKIVEAGDATLMNNFLKRFPDSAKKGDVEFRLLKIEAIGRRIQSYRTVSFVVDSVNIFMGFGIERKAEYVVAIEGNVVDVTQNGKLKYTVDRAYVTNSSRNTYSKGEVGDLRYRPTAEKKAAAFLNTSQMVSAKNAKYLD